MKTRLPLFVACLLVGGAIAMARHATPQAAGLSPIQSSPGPGDYTVAVQVTQGSGSSTWIYTVTRAPSTAKEIPHFTIDFGNCGDDLSLIHI